MFSEEWRGRGSWTKVYIVYRWNIFDKKLVHRTSGFVERGATMSFQFYPPDVSIRVLFINRSFFAENWTPPWSRGSVLVCDARGPAFESCSFLLLISLFEHNPWHLVEEIGNWLLLLTETRKILDLSHPPPCPWTEFCDLNGSKVCKNAANEKPFIKSTLRGNFVPGSFHEVLKAHKSLGNFSLLPNMLHSLHN